MSDNNSLIIKNGSCYIEGKLVKTDITVTDGKIKSIGKADLNNHKVYDANDKIVGIGTTFLDNVYNVSAWNQNVGIITCNIHSDSPVVGLGTTGSTPVGKVSWGRLFSTGSITRESNPISIGVTGFTITSGLTTFPTIQRRVQGLRDTGAIEPS